MGWLRDKFLETIQKEEESLQLKNKIKVKKLEWISIEDSLFSAKVLGNYYYINSNPCSETTLSRFDSLAGNWLPNKYFSSVEEAMSEAQQEFEKEILSYIDVEDD